MAAQEEHKIIRTKTQHFPGVIAPEVAMAAYEFLRDNVPWVDSIKSKRKNKITRKGWSVPEEAEGDPVVELIQGLVEGCLGKVQPEENYVLLGSYLNLYRSGEEWAPSHSHPGCVQAIISLGASRTLKVGTKNYILHSGDVIVFGASQHELLLEPHLKEGRISIATFMKRI